MDVQLNSHADKSMLLFKELRDDGEVIRTSGQARCRMQPMGKTGTGQIFGSWCHINKKTNTFTTGGLV